MCGLSGFIGKPGKIASSDKLRILLLINESRGKDSTGIYGTKLMRQAEPASVFLKDPNFDVIAKANVVLGHTRYGTGGSKTKENAHPFITHSEDFSVTVVGTHNGWFVNEFEIEKKYSIKDEVDSRLMYRVMALSKNKKAFTEFEGPAALAFLYNGIPHIYKRDSRPLFIAESSEGWYYSSIEASLYMAGLTKVQEVANDMLFRFEKGKVFAENMPKQRVTFQKDVNAYNWKTGVSLGLVEELTGEKKYIAPVHHTAQRTGESVLAKKQEAARAIATRFGERLSESFKKTYVDMSGNVYSRFLKNHSNNSDITNLLNSQIVQSDLADEFRRIAEYSAGGIVITKSIVLSKAIPSKPSADELSPVNGKTIAKVRIIGYSESFANAVMLDARKFFVSIGNYTNTVTGSGVEESNSIELDISSLFEKGASAARTIYLFPRFLNGAFYRVYSIDVKKGEDTFIEFYINIDSTIELRNVACGNDQFGQDSDNAISSDMTTLFSLKEKNSTWGGSGQTVLPFLEPLSTQGGSTNECGPDESFPDNCKIRTITTVTGKPTSWDSNADDKDSGEDKSKLSFENKRNKRRRILEDSIKQNPRERGIQLTNYAEVKLNAMIGLLESLDSTLEVYHDSMDIIIDQTEFFGIASIQRQLKLAELNLNSAKKVVEELKKDLSKVDF